MDIFWLAWAVGLFFLAGDVLLRLLDRDKHVGSGAAARAAVAFALGLGAVSLQMFFYSLASIPFGTFAVTLPWAAAAIVMTTVSGRGRARGPDGYGRRSSFRAGLAPGALWPGALLLVIIASQVAYAFSYAVILPVNGWDAWAIWFLKARAFFIDANVSPAFLTDQAYGYDHPDYPLLVPLSVAWVYTAVGRVAETSAKLLWPLQFVSLLVIFCWGILRATARAGRADRPGLALLFTALLSLTPIIIVHAAGLPAPIGGLYTGDFVGYADLALSLYFLSSGVFFLLYVRESRVDGGGWWSRLSRPERRKW